MVCSTLEPSETDPYLRVWNPQPGTTLVILGTKPDKWVQFDYVCHECPPHTYSNETSRRGTCNEWWFGDATKEPAEFAYSGIPSKSAYCGRGEAIYNDWAPHAKAWASLAAVREPYPMCKPCGPGTKARADQSGCEPLPCGRGKEVDVTIQGSMGSVGTRTFKRYEC